VKTGPNAAFSPIALQQNEGEALWFLGALATIKAGGEATAGRVAVIEFIAPAGPGSPLHIHRREDEWFYVIEGELTFWVGGQRMEAPTGSFIYGPRDVHTPSPSAPLKPAFSSSPSAASWLKQLNEVAGRVFQQDLRAAGTGYDVVAELHFSRTQPRDLGGKIIDNQVNAIPAPWSGAGAISHRSPGRTCRPAEQEPEWPQSHVCECRSRIREQPEAEVFRVPCDGGINVIDHITNIEG
jgi:Cupin domain